MYNVAMTVSRVYRRIKAWSTLCTPEAFFCIDDADDERKLLDSIFEYKHLWNEGVNCVYNVIMENKWNHIYLSYTHSVTQMD